MNEMMHIRETREAYTLMNEGITFKLPNTKDFNMVAKLDKKQMSRLKITDDRAELKYWIGQKKLAREAQAIVKSKNIGSDGKPIKPLKYAGGGAYTRYKKAGDQIANRIEELNNKIKKSKKSE